MTYSQTVEWMFQQLPMYQKIGAKAFKSDLSNIEKLSRRLGNPHQKFKSVHVAGTNGKGSVSHMLASVLQECGYKVGLYTSPHLKDFRERIRINGKEIEKQAVVSFIENNRTFFEREQLSFFEMTVGLAFSYFTQEKVDIAIIEVGLGGRLDSTNIIYPEVSVITNIGYDHTGILGETLGEIAAEKAGIIKQNVPVIIGESQKEIKKIFEETAANAEAPLFFAQEHLKETELPPSDLRGAYQQLNIRTVLQTLEVLQESGWKISHLAITEGLENVVRNTGLRGRWEFLSEKPRVICDTAHNKEGLALAMEQLTKEDFQKLHIVMGVVSDKDMSAILPLMPAFAEYYFCKPEIPRGMDAGKLRHLASAYDLKGKSYSSVREAYKEAHEKAGDQDVIYVGGSTFTVAEVL